VTRPEHLARDGKITRSIRPVARGNRTAGVFLIDADYRRSRKKPPRGRMLNSINPNTRGTRKYDSPTDTHRSPDPDHPGGTSTLFPADILKLPEFADTDVTRHTIRNYQAPPQRTPPLSTKKRTSSHA